MRPDSFRIGPRTRNGIFGPLGAAPLEVMAAQTTQTSPPALCQLPSRFAFYSVYSMQVTFVDRTNLNDAVEAALRVMIVDGSLAAGEHLNEVRLAAGLGVSRTPVREALNRLMAEGAVEARPRLGYFVKPLTLEEFENLYDIRPLLDPEALRLAGLPSAAHIEALERLNHRIARAKTAPARMALDDEWHSTLIDRCANRVLLELIQVMMARTKRYELAWMREADSAAVTSDGHAAIIQHLRAGQLGDACAALRENLSSAKPAIAAWLQAREVGEKDFGHP